MSLLRPRQPAERNDFHLGTAPTQSALPPFGSRSATVAPQFLAVQALSPFLTSNSVSSVAGGALAGKRAEFGGSFPAGVNSALPIADANAPHLWVTDTAGPRVPDNQLSSDGEARVIPMIGLAKIRLLHSSVVDIDLFVKRCHRHKIPAPSSCYAVAPKLPAVPQSTAHNARWTQGVPWRVEAATPLA